MKQRREKSLLPDEVKDDVWLREKREKSLRLLKQMMMNHETDDRFEKYTFFSYSIYDINTFDATHTAAGAAAAAVCTTLV